MEKRISIIIAHYNGKRFIKETIASCFHQQYKNIEVIVVDDCSDDDNFIYLQELCKEFPDIKLLRNEINLGMTATYNKGCDISTGEYLTLLGQDDILPYTHIYNCIKCFKNDVSFVYSIPFIINEKGEKSPDDLEMGRHIENNENLYFLMGKENVIASTGQIINRKLFEKAGKYDIKYRNYGEWSLWIRLLKEGKAFLCVGEHALYRRHSDNMTNQFSGIENIDKQIILHKYWNECRELAAHTFSYNLKERFCLFMYRKKIWMTTCIIDKIMLIKMTRKNRKSYSS